MNALIESYQRISEKLQAINDKIVALEDGIIRLQSQAAKDNSARIEKLQEQLKKVDDYLFSAKGFEKLAEKHIKSLNVQTIAAPPGYRVNLKRLRDWATMIDPQADDDPFAQRVYLVSKCDQFFLQKKQKEFKARIEQLQREQTEDTTDEQTAELRRAIEGYQAQRKVLAQSEEVTKFCEEVIRENRKYWYSTVPSGYYPKAGVPAFLAPGAYAAPFAFDPEQMAVLKAKLGDFYDADAGRVLLPVELSNTKENVLAITCDPSKRKKLDRALQNLVLNIVNENPVGTRKVMVLDAVRFNSSSMGSLRVLEDTCAMSQIPRNPEQLTTTLEELVCTFGDIDDMLELYDSVPEYNNTVEPDKQIPLITLIVMGWPNSYDGKDRELLGRILVSYERYGVSLVLVSYGNGEKADALYEKMPEYALQNAVRIAMPKGNGITTITLPEGMTQQFVWYSFQEELPKDYIDSFLKHQIKKESVGNEYPKRYSMSDRPAYVRTYKKLELPFGIDGKDQPHTISFENENFATYLVGASRSGKSTLLHVLIAGLIRNYHPDNLELWLADFKQLEFKPYIQHRPPHVKYVLLDESTELVFDLVDKLTDKMMERQKLFGRLGIKRIDEIKDLSVLDEPLPLIFVILDEFSIMSQSIADSPVYKLRLQNILAKGAALGIRFIFSSQTFTSGVTGLTTTAKAQIQQRISMKGTKEEISATLELSSDMKTEQVRNWMDALPPHYALVKFREGPDSMPQVKRFLVMYFKEDTERNAMIEDIRTKMHPVDHYTPSDLTSYVDKKPVFVDGNAFDAFNPDTINSYITSLKQSADSDLTGEEMFLPFGTPRLMERIKAASLTQETRENLLLIAPAAEQACAASILLSAAKAYKIQGGEVEIWAYRKDRLYRTYKSVFLQAGAVAIEDMEAICDAIRKMKVSIGAGKTDNKLILLLGMDRVCMDFDYVDGVTASTPGKKKDGIAEIRSSFVQRGAVISTSSEEEKAKKAKLWIRKRAALKNQAKREGKNEEETKAFLAAEYTKFEEEFDAQTGKSDQESEADVKQNEETMPAAESPVKSDSHIDGSEVKSKSGAYNAAADFVNVLKQGSRLGNHFMMTLGTFSDLKACGLKRDYFRYRMAFQLSVEDSRGLFDSKVASTLPEHICQYNDGLERYSFRPYLHPGVQWEGWSVDGAGRVVNPYED